MVVFIISIIVTLLLGFCVGVLFYGFAMIQLIKEMGYKNFDDIPNKTDMPKKTSGETIRLLNALWGDCNLLSRKFINNEEWNEYNAKLENYRQEIDKLRSQ